MTWPDIPEEIVVRYLLPIGIHDNIGESCRWLIDLRIVKVESGTIRLNRRSAVVAKSNWRGLAEFSFSNDSRETCRIFAAVGKVTW